MRNEPASADGRNPHPGHPGHPGHHGHHGHPDGGLDGRHDGERGEGSGRPDPSAAIAGSLIDAAGDLDHTTARLRAREATLLEEYERNAAALGRLGPGGRSITGRGWAQDEVVVVEVDATNRLTDLRLDPRALRLGSIENLRRAIMTAFANACEDVADQLRDLGLDAVGDDPVRRMLDGMPELTALLPDQAYEALVPAGPDDEESDGATGDGPHRGSDRRVDAPTPSRERLGDRFDDRLDWGRSDR